MIGNAIRLLFYLDWRFSVLINSKRPLFSAFWRVGCIGPLLGVIVVAWVTLLLTIALEPKLELIKLLAATAFLVLVLIWGITMYNVIGSVEKRDYVLEHFESQPSKIRLSAVYVYMAFTILLVLASVLSLRYCGSLIHELAR